MARTKVPSGIELLNEHMAKRAAADALRQATFSVIRQLAADSSVQEAAVSNAPFRVPLSLIA